MPFVLVTGASQGIGAAIALQFARTMQADLALVSRNVEKLNEVAAECDAAGGVATIFPCDLTNDEAVSDLASSILEKHRPPDILVNNAGLFQPGAVTDTPIADFRHQVDVNLVSAYAITHAFIEPMLERNSGHVVFIASVASIRGYPAGAAYCAGKHGLLGLARALREETKSTGLKVTAVIPGATYTASWAGVDIPESRFMPVEDVAKVVVDVCQLGDRSIVEEILVRPQKGDI